MSYKTHSNHRTRRRRGFTLVETLIAMAIMAIGLLGAAALMSQMSISSNDSRYMSVEALLASEKLEDLNHYPNGDPNVTVPAGTIVGSLAADAAPLTIAGRQVAYSDTVQISSGAGSIEEVTAGTNAGGVATYTSITHKPDGTIVSVTTPSTAAPAQTSDMLLFKRRWTIEKDQPVNNVLRITVRVLLINGTRNQTTTFQTSMVRPAPQP